MFRRAVILCLFLVFAAGCAVETDPSSENPTVEPAYSSAAVSSPELTPEPTLVPIPTATPSISLKFTPEPTATPIPVLTPAPTVKPTPEAVKAPEVFKLNLYTKGAFVQQKTNYWCVPTSVQIMINMIKHRSDHSLATQRAIWKVAWANIKYTGFKASVYGSDPQGWVAALEQFGGGDYEWINGKSFSAALKNAVKSLAVTGRPVGIVAMSGSHAWVMNGFTATADPSKTDEFEVLSVFVTAPGYGLFSYDPAPNTELTVAQFKNRLTRYHSKLTKEVWEGFYVIIRPIK